MSLNYNYNYNLQIPSLTTGTITSGSHLISSGSLFIQNKISSLGYQYNFSSTNGNNITTDLRSVVKRIKGSRANAISAVSTFTQRSFTTNGFWPAICWSPELNLFVAGNNTATSSCQTSPDAITWTARTLGTSIQAWDVCWSSELNLFVMTQSTSSTSPFQTSPDGITWTTRTTGSAHGVTGICWSAELGIFVACAGASGALVSSNGTSWTAYAISGSTGLNQKVCWSAELNLFVMTNGSSGFFYSSNGTSWASVSFTSLGNMQAICWSAEIGIFVAGGSIASTSTFATSPDAINWTVRTCPVTSIPHNNIIWSPELSLFITASNAYTFSSHDGINWTTRSSTLNNSYSCCWSPELSIFAITSNNNVNAVYTSTPRTIPGVVTMNFGDPSCGHTTGLITAMSSQLFSASSAGVSTGVVNPIITLNGTDIGCLYKSTPAQFDFWRIYINLIAGTYTFRLDNATSGDRGIVTVVLNGTSVGTIDTYTVGSTRVIGTITGINVANSGNYKVELQVNTKNASSSNFHFIWNNAAFIRTA